MNSEWIMDVLSDLRNFAEKQSMLDLAEHLDDAILVAAGEIRDQAESQSVVKVNDAEVGTIPGVLREHRIN